VKSHRSRKEKKSETTESWPRKVQPGRSVVTVYRRKTPRGGIAFMVVNYADGHRRRFDCYATETEALEAAETLAKRLDRRDYVAASMTREQAIEYANAIQSLQPFNLSLSPVVTTVTEALKLVGDLPSVVAAAKAYATRHKRTTAKRVAEVVAELLKVKEARGASKRYLDDLRYRLNRFADDFERDTCNITTAEVQEWLDKQKLGSQSYANSRRVLHLFFKFAIARGFASDNPVEGVERIKVRNGEIEIFTSEEMARLLRSASDDFLPCLAIGAFAGLRSAEIERLEWSDIHLPEKFIVVGASRSKTASRRIVPIHDNLCAWLAPYAGRQGSVWVHGHDEYYDAQQETAAATAVEADEKSGVKAQKAVAWKANGLRHSYASYRFAQIGDAGRVAGELGNSATVVHRHYRELVKPGDAERWFSVKPDGRPANLLLLAHADARA
jgi:integrase